MNYDQYVEIKNKPEDALCGENNWFWLKECESAWWGPRHEWESGHSFMIDKWVRGKKLIVTAGANCGMYTRFYANMFDKVFAFEPDPRNFHCMVNNTQFDNVYKFQCGLGDENCIRTFWHATPDQCGCHTIGEKEGPEGMFTVPILTIDTFNLLDCDLIQLDVEQYEGHVIKGAVNTIEKFKPIIILEDGRRPHIVELMDSLGYDIVDEIFPDVYFKHRDT